MKISKWSFVQIVVLISGNPFLKVVDISSYIPQSLHTEYEDLRPSAWLFTDYIRQYVSCLNEIKCKFFLEHNVIWRQKFMKSIKRFQNYHISNVIIFAPETKFAS